LDLNVTWNRRLPAVNLCPRRDTRNFDNQDGDAEPRRIYIDPHYLRSNTNKHNEYLNLEQHVPAKDFSQSGPLALDGDEADRGVAACLCGR
jgi:hypothetical protein